MMIQSVWKNLTGLQKAKSWSQLNTSGVTLNADLEPKIQGLSIQLEAHNSLEYHYRLKH